MTSMYNTYLNPFIIQFKETKYKYIKGDKLLNRGNSDRLILFGSKSLQMVIAAMKLRDTCSLEEKL